jgi:DNA-binding NtrC family response regulator
MPKLRGLGGGRPCLVVGTRADSPVAHILRDAGFEVDHLAPEQDAWMTDDRRPWAAVFVSQGVGLPSLQSLISRAARWRPSPPVVVLGTAAKLQDAVDAMQLGAADFLAPPVSADILLARLGKLVAALPAAGTAAKGPSLEQLGFAGGSAALQRVLAAMTRISRYKANVLVLGESGTGKELIARALHTMGPRRGHLFVPLNCATLGREILENELFGHERGAFTGANERKKGLFELADGGTLFLDEIGELDPSTQAKLLRVLERNEFRRVGGTSKVKVDLSLIAATNRNLEQAIAAGRFREDLYYRLKVVTVAIPPLRERREDIPALIDAFIADFNRRNGGNIGGISPPALSRLMQHDWPGNVRELKNAVESAAVMTTSDTISLADFEGVPLDARQPARHDGTGRNPPPGPSRSPDGGELTVPAGATLSEVERLLIGEHLRRARSKAEAARRLGIGLRTLYTKIRTLQIDTGAAPAASGAPARAESA